MTAPSLASDASHCHGRPPPPPAPGRCHPTTVRHLPPPPGGGGLRCTSTCTVLLWVLTVSPSRLLGAWLWKDVQVTASHPPPPGTMHGGGGGYSRGRRGTPTPPYENNGYPPPLCPPPPSDDTPPPCGDTWVCQVVIALRENVQSTALHRQKKIKADHEPECPVLRALRQSLWGAVAGYTEGPAARTRKMPAQTGPPMP